MDKKIDLDLLKTIMTLMKPDVVAPVAPVLPIAPVSNQQDALMGADIQRIKEDIREIKDDFKRVKENYVTVVDFNSHTRESEKAHEDYEKRLREFGTNITRIMTWGSVVLILSTLLQVGLRVMGK